MVKESDFVSALGLKRVLETDAKMLPIEVSNVNRPGLQFANYWDFFAYERPQLLGKVEMTYMSQLDESTRRERLTKYFSYPMPCIVICRGYPCFDDMLVLAAAHKVPIYSTKKETTQFELEVINYLRDYLAPRETRHGVLVNVYGTGLLITGNSGVGKSEAALELVKRGHQLVADDVVDIRRVSENRLIGEAPELVRHFMEIRGVGIIDIKTMYGVGAVNRSNRSTWRFIWRCGRRARNTTVWDLRTIIRRFWACAFHRFCCRFTRDAILRSCLRSQLGISA